MCIFLMIINDEIATLDDTKDQIQCNFAEMLFIFPW